MRLKNVIISFPNLFTPKAPKGSNTPRFDAQFLIEPNHPQLAEVKSLFDTAAVAGYPNGVPAGTDVCFGEYSTIITPDKDYHRPDLVGWHVLKTTRKAEQGRPVTAVGDDSTCSESIDQAHFFSGALVDAHFDITHYTAGKGGIGGWLNGVMSRNTEGKIGRLDGRPTLEQMFGGSGQAAAPPVTPAPVAPPVTPAPVHQMTPAANGATYEQMIAAGWTDETLISNGMMLPPGGATPAFM